MMLILDTDVMVDLLRGYPPATAWLESLGEAEIGLPGFVIMELIQGCRNKQEQQHLQQRIAPFKVLWPKPEDCDRALATFARLYLSSNLGILSRLMLPGRSRSRRTGSCFAQAIKFPLPCFLLSQLQIAETFRPCPGRARTSSSGLSKIF